MNTLPEDAWDAEWKRSRETLAERSISQARSKFVLQTTLLLKLAYVLAFYMAAKPEAISRFC